MSIDWTAFTPWQALAGGGLIGLSAAMFILLNGRIAGISGIVGGLLRPASTELRWRLAFIGGMLAAPLVFRLFGDLPVPRVSATSGALILAGLLVGVGTRFGSGCTSGHGVCGLSRLSMRSLVATFLFMLFGFATVFLIRHGGPLLTGGAAWLS